MDMNNKEIPITATSLSRTSSVALRVSALAETCTDVIHVYKVTLHATDNNTLL
jgi:hypothetical protein